MPVVGRRVPVIADARVETGLRLGRAEDHARPRPDRLRDRPRPRPAGAHDPRARRPHDRPRASRGSTQAEADERVLDWLSEHDQLEKRESYRHSVGTCERCHTRIEPLVSPQWWCAMDELARPAIEALQARRVALPPREPAPLRDRVARAGARLVRLAPALVGPPDPDLDVPRRPPDLARGRRRARAPSAARPSSSASPDVLDTWFSSALWPFATLGWPERDARARALLPGRRQRHRARDHPPLGEPDDLLRALPARRDPVHRRDHHLDGAGRRRPAHVEEPRHRHRPARGRRASTAPTRRATAC